MAAPVTCKFDEDPIKIEGTIDPTRSIMGFLPRASNSEVDSPIWPEFKLIQDFMAILVTCKIDEDPEKIFKGFLPYMGVVAILVMWPIPREQTFVPPSHWGSIWNLALTGPSVLEKKIFENGGWTDDGQTTEHGYTIKAQVS